MCSSYDSGTPVGAAGLRRSLAALHDLLDPPLDFAHVFEIVVQNPLDPSARAASAGAPRRRRPSRARSAGAQAGQPLRRRTGLAEHPLEVVRGFISTGSGCVSVFHASALKYRQANPSHAPSCEPMSSVPTSSEGKGVSWPIRSAMYWSSDFADRMGSPSLPIAPQPIQPAATAPEMRPRCSGRDQAR